MSNFRRRQGGKESASFVSCSRLTSRLWTAIRFPERPGLKKHRVIGVLRVFFGSQAYDLVVVSSFLVICYLMGLAVPEVAGDVVDVVCWCCGFGAKREKVASARGWITVSSWLYGSVVEYSLDVKNEKTKTLKPQFLPIRSSTVD